MSNTEDMHQIRFSLKKAHRCANDDYVARGLEMAMELLNRMPDDGVFSEPVKFYCWAPAPASFEEVTLTDYGGKKLSVTFEPTIGGIDITIDDWRMLNRMIEDYAYEKGW